MVKYYEPKLKGFFNEMVDAVIPIYRLEKNKQAAKKTVIGFCYLLAGLRNKFVNSFKLNLGLYLASSGTSVQGINTMANLGLSVCHKTIANYKKTITQTYPKEIEGYFKEHMDFLHIFNIDDYHSIHGWRRPETTSLSSVIHLATCVAQLVKNCKPIPAIFNGKSIHNPANIDAQSIIYHLSNHYSGVFHKSYNIIKAQWNFNEEVKIYQLDRINNLTIHIYDDAIKERYEERSMKNVKVIGLMEKNLKSMSDYISALSMITKINGMNRYLYENIAPIVADWPGQLFIRKAITQFYKLQKSETSNPIPAIIQNFVPILGPLHISLNSREHIILIHHNFFTKLFKFVFGDHKVLAKKPKPWRINLLLDLAHEGWKNISSHIFAKFNKSCKDIEYIMLLDILDNLIPATLDIYTILFRSGSFDFYLETIFRIWTFALRWNRKNYNKAPLAFLSDYFYWKDSNHPFANALKEHLVNFNDYYVENFHSRLRANTNPHSSLNTIIEQAYVIGKYFYDYSDNYYYSINVLFTHIIFLDKHRNNDSFIKTFHNTKKYSYDLKSLDFLVMKTSMFLLDYFHSIYKNLGKSYPINPKSKRKIEKYFLATLNEEVSLKLLPTGYHTACPPKQNHCDLCNEAFLPLDPKIIVLICGHSYHELCYSQLHFNCSHCTKYYEEGILNNVNSFNSTLMDDKNITIEDMTNSNEFDELEENKIDEELEIKQENITAKYLAAINAISEW
jgi:hypothetical protein